jgi:hypothetical protein
VAQHQRLRERVVELVGLGVVLEDGGEQVERRHLRARAPGEDVHQPGVVDVLMGDDDELEVLDLVPVRAQRLLELVE